MSVETVAQGRAPGNEARARIVVQAARLASSTGLEGLTIGSLADHLSMPKSSLYTLFGSKEALQLATVESARRTFTEVVVAPSFAGHRTGTALLAALAANYLDHVRRRVFPGGCFFTTGAAEFGSRSGDVHDLIARSRAEWEQIVCAAAEQAVANGELAEGVDPAQLGFELCAMLTGAAIYSVLHDDDGYCDRAQAAIDTLIERVSRRSARASTGTPA